MLAPLRAAGKSLASPPDLHRTLGFVPEVGPGVSQSIISIWSASA